MSERLWRDAARVFGDPRYRVSGRWVVDDREAGFKLVDSLMVMAAETTEAAPVADDPIDWPARFRAAAEVARERGWTHIAAELEDIDRGPGYVAEAIGQVLLGEDS